VEAELFFTQSIEKWREAMGLDKMTIVAHSFGGHLTSRYALKYPERVKKIIFWSPHGTESKPDSYEADLKRRMDANCRYKCFMSIMLW